jgi:hypothetical protein
LGGQLPSLEVFERVEVFHSAIRKKESVILDFL